MGKSIRQEKGWVKKKKGEREILKANPYKWRALILRFTRQLRPKNQKLPPLPKESKKMPELVIRRIEEKDFQQE